MIREDNTHKILNATSSIDHIEKKQITGIESSKLRKREEDGIAMDSTCVKKKKNGNQNQHINFTKNKKQYNVTENNQYRKRKDEDDTNRQHKKK